MQPSTPDVDLANADAGHSATVNAAAGEPIQPLQPADPPTQGTTPAGGFGIGHTVVIPPTFETALGGAGKNIATGDTLPIREDIEAATRGSIPLGGTAGPSRIHGAGEGEKNIATVGGESSRTGAADGSVHTDMFGGGG
jgi:hypothetical protein